MTQLYEANAVLLVGDDPTEQNPLVAWQIRSAIRHRASRLYVINSKSIKLLPKADGIRGSAARRRSRCRPLAGEWRRPDRRRHRRKTRCDESGAGKRNATSSSSLARN